MAKGELKPTKKTWLGEPGSARPEGLQHHRYQERRAGSRQADGDRPRRRARHQEARRDDRWTQHPPAEPRQEPPRGLRRNGKKSPWVPALPIRRCGGLPLTCVTAQCAQQTRTR